MTSTDPVALYLHLPWCLRKCPYCDFNSHEARGEVPEQDYVDALIADLRLECGVAGNRPVASVFFGGGTPSLFSAAAIGRILTAVDANLGIAADCEITLEANPGASERQRFAAYRDAGVNRLSIGCQSFRDGRLAVLGRVHDGAAAVAAVRAARAAGFDNFNVDLMYALPDDDVGGACADLEAAIALEPAHLSWYQLTLEPGTAFHRRPPVLPDDDTVAGIEDSGRQLLAGAGFDRYEVSAWARAGSECRHNLNYWRFGDYLGIGAGAHGKYRDAETGTTIRSERLRSPQRYLRLAGTPEAVTRRTVAVPAVLTEEFLLGALRLPGGFSETDFERATGLAPGYLAAVLDGAAASGLVLREGDRWYPSDRGYAFLDAVLAGLEYPGDGDGVTSRTPS